MTIIQDVSRKIASGQRLTDDDAMGLFHHPSLVEIGALADQVNRQKNSDVVFFNINRHINPTNICALSCKFCAYSRKIGDDGAYAYSIEEMVTKAGEAVLQGATEVHMVGGLHPRWRFDHYKDMLRAIKAAYPLLHIKAFTAVELDWFARRARLTLKEVLEQLQEAGLGSLPGGGAEIFAPEIRDQICETKVTAEQWLETHRLAHGMGMHSNCTMLYGHIESYEHRVDHMRRLRALQDETGGFNAFIPLAFQPFQNQMGIDHYTYGYDDLKTLAIARLYLDNFRHIKAYWIMLGQDIAQIALSYGANDLDGTVIEEKISRMAGGRAGMSMSRRFIEDLILKSQHRPVERDTLYHALGEPKERDDQSARSPLPLRDLSDLRDRVARLIPGGSEAGSTSAAPESGENVVQDLVALAYQAPLSLVAELAARHPAQRDGAAAVIPAVILAFDPTSKVNQLMQDLEQAMEASRSKYQVVPRAVVLQLGVGGDGAAAPNGHWPEGSGAQLTEVVTTLKRTVPGVEIHLSGFKSLWRLGQTSSLPLGPLLECLRDAGVTRVTSGAHESETDLTPSEIRSLHLAMHQAGLRTQAKLELVAPTQGASEPMWESFLKRAALLEDLGRANPLLEGVSLEAATESFITPLEYLRAVALARLAMPSIPAIIADLATIPTLSQTKGLGSSADQHPAEKIAALTLHYGANHLGALDMRRLSPLAVMKQIRASGFWPKWANLEGEDGELVPSTQASGMRHAPAPWVPLA